MPAAPEAPKGERWYESRQPPFDAKARNEQQRRAGRAESLSPTGERGRGGGGVRVGEPRGAARGEGIRGAMRSVGSDMVGRGAGGGKPSRTKGASALVGRCCCCCCGCSCCEASCWEARRACASAVHASSASAAEQELTSASLEMEARAARADALPDQACPLLKLAAEAQQIYWRALGTPSRPPEIQAAATAAAKNGHCKTCRTVTSMQTGSNSLPGCDKIRNRKQRRLGSKNN